MKPPRPSTPSHRRGGRGGRGGGGGGGAGAGAVGGGMARALFAQTFDKLTNAPLQLTDLDAGDKVSKASNACM